MADHLRSVHALTREEYHIKIVFNDTRPTCTCCLCTITPEIAKTVRWNPNGFFVAYSSGHNRRSIIINESPATDKNLAVERCLECNKGFESLRALSSHIKLTHGISSIEYIVKHVYGGITPTCVHEKCSTKTRFNRNKQRFQRYCVEHSHIAESEGGKRGGSVPNPISGKSKNDGVKYLIERSQNYTGSGNPFYGKTHTEETKQCNADKHRLSHEEYTKRTTRKPLEYIVISPYETYESRQTPLDIRCQTCSLEFQTTLENIDRNCGSCAKCHPTNNGRSIAEEEIATFIESLGVDVVRNDRIALSGKEIDVYIPEKKLGIEYNGLWWHCEAKSPDRNRMLTKLQLASSLEIKIFNIFEDEWLQKRRIVEGMIRHRLGIYERRIFARKCKVKPIDVQMARTFVDENHLDGYTSSTTRIGLITDDGELVAVMTLGQPQQQKWKDHLEVKRFCTVHGSSAIGALGKLTAHAKEIAKALNKKALLSYVHLRHGTGDSYVKAGFTHIGTTALDYFWTTGGGSRIGRQVIQANSRLGLSEAAVASSRGVHRIYAAGSVQFTLKV